jgi:hypothetical protein
MGMERAKEDRIENIFNGLKTFASLLFLFQANPVFSSDAF